MGGTISVLTDGELMGRSLGEPEVFRVVFDRHVARVFAFVGSRVGPTLAREVTNDVFTAAFEGRSRFDPAATSAVPWLLGIASHLIARRARDERRYLRAVAKLALSEVDATMERVVERIDAARSRAAILEALAGLSAGEREILLLIAWEDLSYAEVADALGVPLGTVQSRLHRARARLKSQLRSAGVDPEGESDDG